MMKFVIEQADFPAGFSSIPVTYITALITTNPDGSVRRAELEIILWPGLLQSLKPEIAYLFQVNHMLAIKIQ